MGISTDGRGGAPAALQILIYICLDRLFHAAGENCLAPLAPNLDLRLPSAFVTYISPNNRKVKDKKKKVDQEAAGVDYL